MLRTRESPASNEYTSTNPMGTPSTRRMSSVSTESISHARKSNAVNRRMGPGPCSSTCPRAASASVKRSVRFRTQRRTTAMGTRARSLPTPRREAEGHQRGPENDPRKAVHVDERLRVVREDAKPDEHTAEHVEAVRPQEEPALPDVGRDSRHRRGG